MNYAASKSFDAAYKSADKSAAEAQCEARAAFTAYEEAENIGERADAFKAFEAAYVKANKAEAAWNSIEAAACAANGC